MPGATPMSRMSNPSTVDGEIATHFRWASRAARASALRNAEGWMNVVVAIEQLVAYWAPTARGLADARDRIRLIALNSSLAEDVPAKWRMHTPFSELYDHVRRGRNAAIHQGAAARRLTAHAVELALILEDAMAPSTDLVGDYMVRDPVRALPWQPVSFVRHQMLTNSFSYLPVYLEVKGEQRWWLISDGGLARYLRAQDRNGGDGRLRTTVAKAVSSDQLQVLPATCAKPTDAIVSVFTGESDLPVLVVKRGDPPELVGIVTPYDLL
jgi:hypothetical protein